jgi:4-carboxymuconolactone decarboxylase
MRLPLLAPADLSDEQKVLYATMREEIKAHFRGFVTEREDGALEGPWNPWLHFPGVGAQAWNLSKAVIGMSAIPARCREIAILVTGKRFAAAYEIYAHTSVARIAGLSEAEIAAILAGQRPAQLESDEFLAFDLASALTDGGPVSETLFTSAKRVFGDAGCAELIYLVGLYCFVAVTLNGFDVPVLDKKAE